LPLLPSSLLRSVATTRARQKAALALLTARVRLPSDFGRIIRTDGRIERIVEVADASAKERAVDEVNAGVYCFDTQALRRQLEALRPANAQRELYLTDCAAALIEAGAAVCGVECTDSRDVMGVNNRIELARARKIMQQRILKRHMLDGVTVEDPDSTQIDARVRIAPDVTILPQTYLRGATVIGRNCTIGPAAMIVDSTLGEGSEVSYSVIRQSEIAAGVTIGPFAHVRRGSVVEDGAHIGNFVELKNTRMGSRAKAGHLSYLGDATLGGGANIGAGTITCNYDGKHKHRTTIGRRAFIGSNTSLVAPISVGEGALTGAGAVVIRDVEPGGRVAGNPAKPITSKKKSQADRSI